MQVIGIHTPIIKAGEDLASLLLANTTLENGDIVVISSKAIATAEGAAIDLGSISPSDEAREWAARSGRSPEFRQAVLDETRRMNGKVTASTMQLMMTELVPNGMIQGSILVPNAGLDESNTGHNTAIGWPVDCIASVERMHAELSNRSNAQIAVIISDSGSRPRRLGVTAFALTVKGIDPIRNLVGSKDLFGRELHLTEEAVADQLATAGNFLMGNADESTPAAILRGCNVPLTDFCGWVPGIEPELDMFGGTI